MQKGVRMKQDNKAAYFDSQVDAPWASPDYTEQELATLELILSRAKLREGMRILEPGCGTGRLTEILARRVGSTGHIVAIDISPAMVAAASTRLAAKPNVRLMCSRVENTVLDPSFDLIMCHQVFPHFEDKQAVLSYMASLLTPEGRIVVCHLIGSKVINDHHRKVHPAVADDTMPGQEEMARLFSSSGMVMHLHWDDERGYLLTADRSRA